jgi:hypothetical protein
MSGSNLTPSQRSLRARLAAHALHAKGGTSTEAGTAAFLSRFEREVDPDGILGAAERARRAAHARKAYMARLALASARKRTSAAGKFNRDLSLAIDRATIDLEKAMELGDEDSAAKHTRRLASLEARIQKDGEQVDEL